MTSNLKPMLCYPIMNTNYRGRCTEGGVGCGLDQVQCQRLGRELANRMGTTWVSKSYLSFRNQEYKEIKIEAVNHPTHLDVHSACFSANASSPYPGGTYSSQHPALDSRKFSGCSWTPISDPWAKVSEVVSPVTTTHKFQLGYPRFSGTHLN